ncbi:MAG TPA: ribonuclease HII [Steroidobacteraceae bacterium]|nr:ribonuclease HII [Steroidobacteraceae bacterium]
MSPAPRRSRKVVAVVEKSAKRRVLMSLRRRMAPPVGRVAGVDEAGRGPLAGPVVAAAVILDPGRRIRGLADSKALAREERERLAPIIRARALAWAVAWADRDEIDALNILGATFLAMRRALLRLPVCPNHVAVDGNQLPPLADLPFACTAEAIVEGDARVAAISAASILAKTYRDAMMEALDPCYPGFGLAAHKGYGTPAHLAALQIHEPSAQHRRSFNPVRVALGLPELAELPEVSDLQGELALAGTGTES